MSAAKVEKKRWTRWTDEEEETLISLYRQGFKYKEIAAQIGRPISTTQNIIKYYLGIGVLSRRSDRFSLNPNAILPARAVRNTYKDALPPEKWPRAEHFIAAFSRCARLSESVGRTLDVWTFMSAYRDICQKKEDFRLL